jgi:hypothetical protein
LSAPSPTAAKASTSAATTAKPCRIYGRRQSLLNPDPLTLAAYFGINVQIIRFP